jgi:hypothetical protein
MRVCISSGRFRVSYRIDADGVAGDPAGVFGCQACRGHAAVLPPLILMICPEGMRKAGLDDS